MFNAFEATTRLKGKPGADSTAGVAKTSTVTARSKYELRELGERMNWTPRKMTMAEVRELSSQELLWREQFDAENLNAALELPSKLSEGKAIDKAWAAKRLWDDQAQATPEQSAAIWQALERFKQTYPQFIQTRRENEVILLWLKDRNMEVTFPNLIESFEANALAGKLWLNPNAVDAGSETEVSGQDLLRHRNFHKLLQSQARVTDLDRLSANEFLAQHGELKDQRTPPLISARQDRSEATAAHFAQSESTTARSGSTSVVDYPHVLRGVPAQPDKVSFRKKVQSMTAEEIRRECEIDPSFKDALDQL